RSSHLFFCTQLQVHAFLPDLRGWCCRGVGTSGAFLVSRHEALWVSRVRPDTLAYSCNMQWRHHWPLTCRWSQVAVWGLTMRSSRHRIGAQTTTWQVQLAMCFTPRCGAA